MRNNAPLPLAGGPVVRITHTLVLHSQSCLITFDYRSAGAGDPSTSAALAVGDQWVTNFGVNFQACFSQDVSWTGFYAALISSNVVPTGVRVFAAALPGSIAQASLSSELCATITRYTDVRGQHGIGRVLLPGIPTTYVTPAADPNRINATGLSAYNAFKTHMQAALVVGGLTWNPVVSTRPVAPATVVTRCANVSSTTVRAIMGTCRRRREGRGI